MTQYQIHSLPALLQRGKVFWVDLIKPEKRELCDQSGGAFKTTPSEDKRVKASLNWAVVSSPPLKCKAGPTLPSVQRNQFSGGWRIHSPNKKNSFFSDSAGVVPPHLHCVRSHLPTILLKPEAARARAHKGSAPNDSHRRLPHLTRYFREETVGLLGRARPKLCRAWRGLTNRIITLASHHKQTWTDWNWNMNYLVSNTSPLPFG